MDLLGEAAHLGRLEGALSETPVRFDGLEGLLAPGSGAGATAGSLVVVCHPHPHYGGNMRNNVVAAVCGGLARAGVATLRFDLRRGADDGDALLAANAADVGAAVAFARSRGYGRVGLVAYSWSTLAAARHLAGADAPAALALVAPPVHADGAGGAAAPFLDFLAAHPAPSLLCLAEFDEYCRAEDLEAFAASRCPRVTVATDAQADHFYRGREAPLVRTVARFVEAQLQAAREAPPAPPPRLAYAVRPSKGALLRSGPGLDSPLVGEVPRGAVVEVDGRATTAGGVRRCRIVAPRGWLSEKTLARAPRPPAA